VQIILLLLDRHEEWNIARPKKLHDEQFGQLSHCMWS